MAASRYEDEIWKEFTGQDCVSTMSIFEQAEKEGKNYNETISGVSADRETLAEVEQAVEQGYTVILPEKETVLNDWKGTGYLILNPETGAGAYRISGGLSGGSTSTAVTIAGVCAVIVLICLLVLLAVGIVNLLAFMYAAALGLAAQAVCALMLLLMLEFYGGLAVRISNLTEAVRKQAAGDASQEEYILWEFLMSAAEIAVAVGLMAVFAYIEGRPSKGEGETGSGGGKDQGNGSASEDSGGSGNGFGSGNGSGDSGGSGSGGGKDSGSGDSGGSGTGSGGNGSGETGAGGSESGINSIIKNGKVSIDDLKANPSVFSGKSVDEIAQALTDAGYDVTVKASTRSRSGAQIIKINNPGGGKNISQVQVSPGGGRHGSSPYVKISTTDQGIIKIIDGSESLYKTDGKETATIIFSGGN